MSNPEHERDRSKEDPLLGFLDESADQSSRASERPVGKESRYPVIRKPVPVSESGALRAPKSQIKGDARSAEADATEAGDDFGFLDDVDLSSARSSASDVFDDDWDRPVAYSDEEPPKLWRRIALFISICALVTGGFLFSLPWLKQQGVTFDMPEELPFGLSLELPFDIPGFGNEAPEPTDAQGADIAFVESNVALPETTAQEPPANVADSETGTASESAAAVAPVQTQGSSLGSRFRDALSEVETLVANEQYDEADQAIAALDRSVYGYGVTEFKALEARVNEALNASRAAAAEEEAKAREAEEAERVRVEAEAAARQAEQARAEAARAEAARAEAARQQAEAERQRELAAEERVAAQNAIANAETNEAEQAAAVQRAEAERLARVNQAAEQRRRAIAEQAASDRLATDRAVAEQRAENERRAAAQLREEQTVARAPEPQRSVPANRPITDADLQLVYGRFSDLAIAIETGNINDVISLTSRSTSRIQQFLQVFENSDFVSARITNVATRNARGSVTGTLSISGITRADGSTVEPPANLRSITLTSTREGSGWSLIDW